MKTQDGLPKQMDFNEVDESLSNLLHRKEIISLENH